MVQKSQTNHLDMNWNPVNNQISYLISTGERTVDFWTNHQQFHKTLDPPIRFQKLGLRPCLCSGRACQLFRQLPQHPAGRFAWTGDASPPATFMGIWTSSIPPGFPNSCLNFRLSFSPKKNGKNMARSHQKKSSFWGRGVNGAFHHAASPFSELQQPTPAGWWLNQPIWKICAVVKLDIFPKDRGFKKLIETTT